jgi:hypothetical protein
MMEEFLKLVDPSILDRSGSVFYSGRAAFSKPSPVYLLGLNPGGDPIRQAHETIRCSIADALKRQAADWSAYVDESWNGKPPGTYRMQPRIRHMLGSLRLDPRRIPASNVVFVRSTRESDLEGKKASLLAACWPVHQGVIDKLGVRTLLCLGSTAGKWTRDALGANELVDQFQEDNARRWTSQAHRNAAGQHVITLTHPSIAAWNVKAADPTPLVARILATAHQASP